MMEKITHEMEEDEDYDSGDSDSEDEAEYSFGLTIDENMGTSNNIEIKSEVPDALPQQTAAAAAKNSSFPPRCNYEGKYGFKLSISYNVRKKATEMAIFSKLLSKLYITKDYTFRTICYAKKVPSNSVLRATLYYLLPEDAMTPVLRCPVHIFEDQARGVRAVEHVLKSLQENAFYEKDDATGRYSVVVPYPELEENRQFATFQFKLTCYSSCCGGIYRRPLVIYFTLENNQVLLGRQLLEVKICACPARDLKQEEKKYLKSKQIPIIGNEQSNENSNDYVIKTDNPKLFHYLLSMKQFYETKDIIWDFETENHLNGEEI